MDASKVAELKLFVNKLKSNPSIINDPSLGFFKSYLQSLGARIPEDTEPDESDDDSSNPEEHADRGSLEDELVESDIELDNAAVLEPDNDPPQKMGDPSVEVTEENRDAAQMSKLKAMDALSEGKLDEAIEHLTGAILLNPSSAILYATRASVYVKMNKPNAAIRDANAALEINSDSAKGHKFRGIAKAMLGQWEEATKDLHVASNLDYDEEIGSALKKVEPNAHKIEEHRRKYERLRKERELKKAERERERRRAEAQAAYEREKAKAHSSVKRSDSEPTSLQDGQVVSIHSASELETKFNAASNLSRLVILYFTATWCGPCRFISPLYTSLAGKYTKVVFLKVDIDELRDVAARWNISSVPSFFFIKNGKEIDRVVGADKNDLERKIAQYASQQS
ncbi:TPR repeat-containing thioredoxin TDX [Macadamia integrifolia]|uniref:TPR repeat-containing thioredoxin TDX n=1 Tax=Macadamia integrifolia TaxID=60698 RepID=UPI001C4ECD05|nr:TPR repeat-containing thioredoxin TDX [Macadamia integrifolia]